MRMLEVFVLKFKTVSKIHLARLMNKSDTKKQDLPGQGNGTATEVSCQYSFECV